MIPAESSDQRAIRDAPRGLPASGAASESSSTRAPRVLGRGRMVPLIVGTAAMLYILQSASAVLIPIALGFFVSFALEPVVRTGTRMKVPRPLGAALVLLTFVAAIATATYYVADDAAQVASELPDAARNIRRVLRKYQNGGEGPIDQVKQLADEIAKGAAEAGGAEPPPKGVVPVQIQQPSIDMNKFLWQGSVQAAAVGAEIALLIFLVYFLLASGDLIKRKMVSLAGPALSRSRAALQLLEEMSVQMQRFFFVQLVTSFFVGLASWLVFRWFGLDNAAVWAVAAAVLNTIPYFGPVIGMGVIGAAALIQFESLLTAFTVASVSLVITGLEGFLIMPLLVGRASRMNEIAVFVALLFWGWVWGAMGMLLAVPMMMAIKVVCDRVPGLESIGEILGD